MQVCFLLTQALLREFHVGFVPQQVSFMLLSTIFSSFNDFSGCFLLNCTSFPLYLLLRYKYEAIPVPEVGNHPPSGTIAPKINHFPQLFFKNCTSFLKNICLRYIHQNHYKQILNFFQPCLRINHPKSVHHSSITI